MITEKAIGWKSDHIRVSIFKSTSFTANPENLFKDIFKCESDTVSNNRIEGEFTAAKVISENVIQIAEKIDRIDFLYTPLQSDNAINRVFIDDPIAIVLDFSEKILKYISESEYSINRVAISGGYLYPTRSVEDTYRFLQGLIKIVSLDPKRHREFNLKINSPVLSESVQDLQINRITQWSAMGIRAGVLLEGIAHQLKSENFCLCIVDVNTDGLRTKALDNNIITAVQKELARQHARLLEEGVS